MKNFNFKNKSVFLLMVLGIILNSCTDLGSDNQVSQETDYLEIILSADADNAIAIMDDIAFEVYNEQEDNETSRISTSFNSLPDCVTLTLVAEQNSRELTLDFGTEGCLVHGNELKGIMVLSWERDPEAQEVLITQTLENFYFNEKNILGGKTILRELSNENENPQATHTADYTIIWPNGAEASRGGVVIREWVEGFGSGDWSDNVFEITGYWTTNFVNGNSHNYEVIIPIRREVICYYFVQGSVDIDWTNFAGVLDYGDGTCDNKATFTFDSGAVINITLN